jgi:hypothetical protein
MPGIKETKELVVGSFALAGVIVKELKDGFQASKDIPAIVSQLLLNPEFKAKLEAAAEGINGIGGEVKDISLLEGFELVGVVTSEAQKLVAAISA